jgi:AcrR family transcriptional regulator
MDLRSMQKAERRERILDVAREMIAASGYEALTMRDLARAARLTVPTIYNLIGSKEEVLFAAIEEQTARFRADIEAAKAISPAARLILVVESCTRELLRLPGYYRTLLRLLLASDAARVLRHQVHTALVRELERGLETLQAKGGLATWVEPAALAPRLAGQIANTSLQWVAGAVGDERLTATATYDVCLVLLGVARGRARAELEKQAHAAQRRMSIGAAPAPRQAVRETAVVVHDKPGTRLRKGERA